MEKIKQKINELLSNMSIREKIGQCIMIEPFFLLSKLTKENNESYIDLVDPKFLDKMLNEYHIGFFLFGGVSSLGNDSAEEWTNYLKQMNEYAKTTRLKIPLLFGADAVHGVNFVKGSTIFSHNLGVTSTWNTDLAKSYASIVSKELAAIGLNCNFAPTIDVARDQRWGRVYESLGEDPYLASKMSEALVLGMQSNPHVAACGKHYLGYGESSNGMDRTPANLSERSILETHLPPFEAAIKAGVKTIMVNGGDVNGTPMPASKDLLTGVLRKKLGFKGITLSDWEDVNRLYKRHHIVQSSEEAILKAFNAGLDVNMAVSDLSSVDIMEKLVAENKITIKRLNEACANVLRVKFELGLFERDDFDITKAIELCGNLESKNLAKQVALESITLLKNKNNILPIDKKIKSILLTGKTANSKRHLCGGWTLGWDSAKEEDLNFPTILEALKEKVPNAEITYVPDIQALKALNVSNNHFDLCISVVGEEPHSEWVGDTPDLAVEKGEINLLMSAFKTKIPVVMVSILGRPLNVAWANDNLAAILWAYYPATEGANSIADVLFGDYNPSGKTPITFPKSGNQVPIVYNARKYNSPEITTKYEPLYPFGYGLSYTNFEYSDLEISDEVSLGEDCFIKVKVKNIGNRVGAEVVQLYLEDKYASVTRPIKSLKGFTKINLLPNEEKTVELILTKKDLSFYNDKLQFVQEQREIEVSVANLTKTFQVK
ncbi:MAG: glycoside hydrolase family 3 C-terminal domain-containing protein [Tenericutes bacterium]|nr:glycoside hydrolase family 3 C-terminal domain-containing protein [Mycoplasmatota bacterium]